MFMIPSFSGEVAQFKDTAKTVFIDDAASYRRYIDFWEATARDMYILAEIYDNQHLDAEDIYLLTSFLPFNRGISHNPRYIESNNSNWRGFWQLANKGQNINANLFFVGVLYNKSTDKVFTIIDLIETDKSLELNSKLDNIDIENLIEEYMKTAYKGDPQANKQIDEHLKLIKFLN